MDHARCLCPASASTPPLVINPACPIHGLNPLDTPIKPWRLSENDRQMLRQMRIDPEA